MKNVNKPGKIIAAAAVLSGTMFMLSGCGDYAINLITNDVKVSVGDPLSTDMSDYVRASSGIMDEMQIDLSAVNKDRMGTYRVSVTYRDSVKYFNVIVTDLKAPRITLKNEDIYLEQGGTVKLEDVVGDVTDESDFDYGFSDDMTKADRDKTMMSELTFTEIGEYKGEIIAKDTYNNCSVAEFNVHVVESGKVPDGNEPVINYSKYMNYGADEDVTSVEGYESKTVYYGIGNNVDPDTNRPEIGYYTGLYGKFAVDFIQPDSGYVWLTFNEFSEAGNTEAMLDILKDRGVSAVFFVTLDYVRKNPEIVQRIIDEGHVLGNYTASGREITDLSVNDLTNEMDTLYNYVRDNYGYEMYLFRTPSGCFSEQALALAQSKGYRTVFWSFAYADWDAGNQPDLAEALENALNKVHGGAIYLLSGSSTTNRAMLGDMIDGIRSKGYEFATYQKVK